MLALSAKGRINAQFDIGDLMLSYLCLLSPLLPWFAYWITLMFLELEIEILLFTKTFRELLQLFTTPELINWKSLHLKYESDLREATSDITAAEVFGHNEIGKKCWQDLKNRVVEHVSGFYI